MTDREREVLDALRKMPGAGRASQLARVLNFDGACGWCPVGPPRAGEQCAAVPRSSRDRVERVLRSLLRKGRVRQPHRGTRLCNYFLAVGEAAPAE